MKKTHIVCLLIQLKMYEKVEGWYEWRSPWKSLSWTGSDDPPGKRKN